eukprot:GILJ01023077.1.p1 GENE.GILJ01023077.1~~GILJ01023077.1.p1  ORF type:complete len:271 (-),score=36.89 GILJ01023077.1:639-1451(-)
MKQQIHSYFELVLNQQQASDQHWKFQRAYLQWRLGWDRDARTTLLDNQNESLGEVSEEYKNHPEYHLLVGDLSSLWLGGQTTAGQQLGGYDRARQLGCPEAEILYLHALYSKNNDDNDDNDENKENMMTNLKQSENALCLQRAGLMYADQGDHETAYDLLRKAVSRGNASAANHGGTIALRNNNLEIACQFWEAGTHIDPCCALLAGQELMRVNKRDLAKEFFIKSGPLHGYYACAEMDGRCGDKYKNAADQAFMEIANFLEGVNPFKTP